MIAALSKRGSGFVPEWVFFVLCFFWLVGVLDVFVELQPNNNVCFMTTREPKDETQRD